MLSNDYKRKVSCMAAGAPAAFCRTSRRGFASPQSARSSYNYVHCVTRCDWHLDNKRFSGRVLEGRICNREVAGSNLGRDYSHQGLLSLPSLWDRYMNTSSSWEGKGRYMAHSHCGRTCGCAGKTEIPWEHVPYVSASALVMYGDG